MILNFTNRFLKELPGDESLSNRPGKVMGSCWSKVMPTAVAQPELIAISQEVANLLNLHSDFIGSLEMAQVFAGNVVMPGMETYATCYGGHQFGAWAGQLGDGRAIFLGEVYSDKEHWEIQLKGAGQTPYSRFADGRAVLRSSVREFLCSEAMHYLGIPTTRALSLVLTGEQVMRDIFYDGNPAPEKGAIVCRVAQSFLRFGHYEIFAKRNEENILSKLINFTIKHYFPDLYASGNYSLLDWLNEVANRTAYLVSEWMRVGFVHGVMNTDNMSILGLTLDYGPYGWIESFEPSWTPNMSDYYRRYSYFNQPSIARWNIQKLAEALIETEKVEAILEAFDKAYYRNITKVYTDKLGFEAWSEDDNALLNNLFNLLHQAEIDMTIFFRKLSENLSSTLNLDLFDEAFYRNDLKQLYREPILSWLSRYRTRLSVDNERASVIQERMSKSNPCYILRNHLVQEAIELAEQGDYTRIKELLEVLKKPYEYQEDKDHFTQKQPEWARAKAGCSMLSCSS